MVKEKSRVTIKINYGITVSLKVVKILSIALETKEKIAS